MLRKAKNASVGQKLAKNTPVTLEIMENYLEPHFAALQEDSDNLRQEIDQKFVSSSEQIGQRFNKQDDILKTILQIVQTSDIERREMRSDLWSYDKRILNLEKKLA